MKKILIICCLLMICGCSHSYNNGPSEFDGEMCVDGVGKKCLNVRKHYTIIRMKGIPREEFMDNACNENAQFVKVHPHGTLDESFFYGANERSCMATLAGCGGLYY